MMSKHPLLVSFLAVAALLPSCVGVRDLADPVLAIRTRNGNELGISTDYGVVFLGRTARSGAAEITAWYGDGPSIESTVIEPVGSGLFTAETEIRLPEVQLSFDDPKPGDELLVFGRDARGAWNEKVRVEEDPRVLGLVTTIPARLRGASDQIGAGVFVVPESGEKDKKLVGLVAGELTLTGADGERRYLAVVGPQDLWRLVTHRRDLVRKKRWVYREDIL